MKNVIELEDQDDAQLMLEALEIVLEMMSQGGITKEGKARIKQWIRIAKAKENE